MGKLPLSGRLLELSVNLPGNLPRADITWAYSPLSVLENQSEDLCPQSSTDYRSFGSVQETQPITILCDPVSSEPGLRS